MKLISYLDFVRATSLPLSLVFQSDFDEMDLSGQLVSFVPAIRVKVVYEIKRKDPIVKKIQEARSDLIESVGEKRLMFQREMEKIQKMEANGSTFIDKPYHHDPRVSPAQNSSVVTMHPAELLRLIRHRKQMSVTQSAMQDVTETVTTSAASDDRRKRKFSESEEKPAKRPRYKFNPDYVWTDNRTNVQDSDDDLELDILAKEIERDVMEHLNSLSDDETSTFL